jgi:ubiquinone/menaquinone biosynthesis C-methylase UbiE
VAYLTALSVRWAGVPLDTASINIVVTIWTFCTIPDAHRGLVELTRVLKPGGALLFVEPAPASDAKDCAAAAGAALAPFLRGLGCRVLRRLFTPCRRPPSP